MVYNLKFLKLKMNQFKNEMDTSVDFYTATFYRIFNHKIKYQKYYEVTTKNL